ncbi:MAG: cupin domain-containing protein [Candidatus Odinarchaeia archaeon]
MYKGNISNVEVEDVNMEGAKNVKIQWLISKEKGGAPNFAMRRFILNVGGRIPKHKHNYEHEIFILEGEGKIGVEGNGEEITKPGDFIYIPPNVYHWYENVGSSQLSFLCIIPQKNE